jgi:hypothetical protein
MLDPWFMAELNQATRLLDPEKQEIAIESLRVLQEFMDRNVVIEGDYVYESTFLVATRSNFSSYASAANERFI